MSGVALMLKLIELIIIAAAVDGKIDESEQEAILRILTKHTQTPLVSKKQLAGIQNQLTLRFKEGETRQHIIEQAARSLDENSRHLTYAISLEVVMADGRLTVGEVDYLREQRSLFNLDTEKVEKIHFSAKLRHGFGTFD